MTSLYMLDTDTCAFILRRSSQALLERIRAVPLERQVMSIAYLPSTPHERCIISVGAIYPKLCLLRMVE